MWKAGGWWVTRKSFCIVCCCFGTQTGLRKKKTVVKIPFTTTETCSFYPGRKNKGDATTNRPKRFNEVYT